MAFPTPNSTVPVGVAIGVALAVALDNIPFLVLALALRVDGGHGQLPSSETGGGRFPRTKKAEPGDIE